MGNGDETDPRAGGRGRASLVDEPLIASGRRLDGRYRLEHPLGHGGMASVWLATDERLGRPVAIKVLSDRLATDEEYLGRFRREAQVAARLQHPNLVGVYDFDAGPRPYLVMEYLPGGDLAARLRAGNAPDPERLARELLSALRHIHAAGVLHRDIKPQNVLIDADGRARLTDFGIARPRDAASLTHPGHVIGTESYIAPEVMAGDPADERSDLFALGVVLADAARGGAGATLWELTDRMRDPVPERRPRSAAATLATLERGSASSLPGTAMQPYKIAGATTEPNPIEQGTDPHPPWPAEPSRPPFEPTVTRRAQSPRRWALAALALALLAGGTVIAIAIGGGDDSDPTRSRANGRDAQRAERGGERRASRDAGEGEGARAGAADSSPTPAAPPSDAEAVPTAGGDGAALNDQGFSLLQEGRYEEAVPVLERAVGALESSGDELTYNYALYNLGSAYLGAGRPGDAIPVLEQRMQYDNQLETVRETLDRAYVAAGREPSGGAAADEKPGKGPPPGKGPESGRGADGGVSAP